MRWTALLMLAACGADDAAILEACSASGLWHVTASTDPDPPQAGVVAVTFEVTDADGAPVALADLHVAAFMEAHDHAQLRASAAPVEAGTLATELTFAMPGRWDLRVLSDTPSWEDEALLLVDVR